MVLEGRVLWIILLSLIFTILSSVTVFGITCYPSMPYGMSCSSDETIKDWCGEVKCKQEFSNPTYYYATNKCEYFDVDSGSYTQIDRSSLSSWTSCKDTLISFCNSAKITGNCDSSKMTQDADSTTGWVCKYQVIESCTYTTTYDEDLGISIGVPQLSCNYGADQDCLAADKFGSLPSTLSYATCGANGCGFNNPDFKQCCDGDAIAAGSGGYAWCPGGRSVPDGVHVVWCNRGNGYGPYDSCGRACSSPCGNGRIDSGEQCDKLSDGTFIFKDNKNSCTDWGVNFYPTANLKCNMNTCQVDTSQCGYCGNNQVEPAQEKCDPPGITAACTTLNSDAVTYTSGT